MKLNHIIKKIVSFKNQSREMSSDISLEKDFPDLYKMMRIIKMNLKFIGRSESDDLEVYDLCYESINRNESLIKDFGLRIMKEESDPERISLTKIIIDIYETKKLIAEKSNQESACVEEINVNIKLWKEYQESNLELYQKQLKKESPDDQRRVSRTNARNSPVSPQTHTDKPIVTLKESKSTPSLASNGENFGAPHTEKGPNLASKSNAQLPKADGENLGLSYTEKGPDLASKSNTQLPKDDGENDDDSKSDSISFTDIASTTSMSSYTSKHDNSRSRSREYNDCEAEWLKVFKDSLQTSDIQNIIRLLDTDLAKSAINISDKETGKTPLHFIVEKTDNEELVRKAIEIGAKLFCEDHNGETPLDIARNMEKKDRYNQLVLKVQRFISQNPQENAMQSSHLFESLKLLRQKPIELSGDLKEKLKQLVLNSKNSVDEGVHEAAADAISILVKARVSFSGEDLSGVNIPGADLSNGIFHNTNFSGACLDNVNIYQAFFQDCNFDNARMNHLCTDVFTEVSLGDVPITDLSVDDNNDINVATMDESIGVIKLGEMDASIQPKGVGSVIKSMLVGSSYVVTGRKDGWIQIFQNDEEIELEKPLKHDGVVSSLDWNVVEEGEVSKIVSGSYDRTIKVWEFKEDNTYFELDAKLCLRGHDAGVTSVKLSNDGNHIVSSGYDQTVRIWLRKNDGYELEFTKVMTYMVRDIVFNESKFLMVGTSNQIQQWTIDGQTEDPVNSDCTSLERIKVSGNAVFVSGTHYDESWIQKIDLQSNEVVLTLKEKAMVTALGVSDDGKYVISGRADGTIRKWDIEKAAPSTQMSGHLNPIHGLAVDESNDKMASICFDKILVWALSDRQLINTIKIDETIYNISFLSNQLLIGQSYDDLVSVWNIESGEKLALEASKTIISSGEFFYSINDKDNKIRKWGLQNGRLKNLKTNITDEVENIYSFNDGIVFSSKNCIYSYIGKTINTITEHVQTISTICLNKSSEYLIFGDNGGNIIKVRVESKELLKTWQKKSVDDISVDDIKVVKIFDLGDDKLLAVYENNDVCLFNGECKINKNIEYSSSLMINSINTVGVIQSSFEELTLYSLQDLNSIMTLKTQELSCHKFSDNGKYLFYASEDFVIHIVNIERKTRTQLYGHQDEITSITVNKSGDTIFSTSEDKTIKKWKNGDRGWLLVDEIAAIGTPLFCKSNRLDNAIGLTHEQMTIISGE